MTSSYWGRQRICDVTITGWATIVGVIVVSCSGVLLLGAQSGETVQFARLVWFTVACDGSGLVI